MELKQLRYFKTAAEFQHITKAANALDINQPVLSRSLSALEEELGVELFDHVRRGITLNENGIYFYKRVCEIFATLEDACEDLKTQNYDAASVPIRIASNTGLYIPGLLKYLREKMPSSQITYITADRTELLQHLRNKEVDFIICSPMLEPKYQIKTQLLLNEHCPIIYPEGHWLSTAKEVSLRDLAFEPFIAVAKGFGIRDASDNFFELAGVDPIYSIVTNDTRSVRELVKDGCGIAFTSSSTIQMDPYFTNNHIFIQDPPCVGTVSLSYLTATSQNFHNAEFIKYTLEHFQHLQELQTQRFGISEIQI